MTEWPKSFRIREFIRHSEQYCGNNVADKYAGDMLYLISASGGK
jgi:hypothetical protein